MRLLIVFDRFIMERQRNLIEIDGSQKSGSGTILRLSIAIAAILGEPLHICNIRQNRPQSGLKPQHLEAVFTAAKLCDADLTGATINSRELWFRPKKVKGGRIEAEIGTAGSIPMLLMTILPICTFAENTVNVLVSKGGTDVKNSPTINYLRFVLLPMLGRLGLKATLTVHKYGYYPKGNGEVSITVEPCRSLQSLRLESFGKIRAMRGVSVCTFLADRKVAERQAKSASDRLKKDGYVSDVDVINDSSNHLQKGSSLVLWAETDTNVILGADAIGELRKPSETVGMEAAEKLLTEVSARPTVDIYLADMLVPYVALARGESTYFVRTVSEHLQTNVWLMEKMLNAKFVISKADRLWKVQKTG
jgi:RNA 3'-phosphate cyclase